MLILSHMTYYYYMVLFQLIISEDFQIWFSNCRFRQGTRKYFGNTEIIVTIVTSMRVQYSEILASFQSYRHHGFKRHLSYRHKQFAIPASRRTFLRSRMNNLGHMWPIRVCLLAATCPRVIHCKYNKGLVRTNAEISPRSCEPVTAAAILGCR